MTSEEYRKMKEEISNDIMSRLHPTLQSLQNEVSALRMDVAPMAKIFGNVNGFDKVIKWILIRFAVFAIFGYYNGLLYKKISSRFKYTKTYFIVTTLIFYYLLLGLLQLIGGLFYGGLP